MALAKSQQSLKKWTKQKWRTKSGKKSADTGERYLPESAIKSLSSSEYAATTRKKREDTKKENNFLNSLKEFLKKLDRIEKLKVVLLQEDVVQLFQIVEK